MLNMTRLIPAVYLLIAGLAVASGHRDPVASRQADDRMATVTDLQGTALVRPVGRARWSRLHARSVILPGDLVRTPVRGAHAVELAWPAGGTVVLGPGTLVEFPPAPAVDPAGQESNAGRGLRLLRGDVEVSAGQGPPVICSGPGEFRQVVEGTVVLRGQDRVTAVLDESPRWLTGYRASTTDEWMGSLLATVDGRDVPLSVGYHSVDVVIRDQIARTTVEQSFVNSTSEQLEGVFYFPLPADASISGYGMWIGAELVEADIVERERARAIYEDILRRKKDPGLLEWSGGNMFKARVFPIEPRSEKRIRLRYTQVLPLEGSTLRYRYALRSELLRSNPLRRLQIKVSAFSGTEITSVASPTHEVRARNTGSAATVEFDAEEFAPDRDFEAVVKLAPGSPLVATSHRRGDDGYLMLQLSPPGDAAEPWRRDLLPDGAPLDVVVMADTSGSMDEAARSAQSAFVGGLLQVLGREDRFRLMACDVGVGWFNAEPATVTEEVIGRALEFLDRRPSLGWTDLDLAFAEATGRAGEGAVVIYVGDGIGTTGDADPVALAQRLSQLQTNGAVFHAVSTGSTYEQAVLDAVARMGGGTTRPAGDDPAQTAYGLLAEMAQPALADVSVEIKGLRTARVYPAQLPRLAAGRQQIVLGRYLPGSGSGRGEVVVTGTRAGEPVRFTAPMTVGDDGAGNSFLPRLWARRHLDALLAKGRSAAVQAEIVAFSRRFGVLTPFTSFLVLENDEERERYGVTREVKMRDGERFFAAARDAVSTEVLRQQMKEARGWRLRLRQQMLDEIDGLGEDLPIVVVSTAEQDKAFDSDSWNQAVGLGGGAGGKFGGRAGGRFGMEPAESMVRLGVTGSADFEFPVIEDAEVDEFYSESGPSTPGPAGPRMELKRKSGLISTSRARSTSPSSMAAPEVNTSFAPAYYAQRHASYPSLGFPGLEGPPQEPPPVADPDWAPELLAMVRRLDRRPRIAEMSGGLKLTSRSESLHPLRGRTTSWTEATGLVAAGGWFVKTSGRAAQSVESWSVAGQRGVVATGLRLGRRRPSVEADASRVAFPLEDLSLSELSRSYRHYSAQVISSDPATTVLLLTGQGSARVKVELTIDHTKDILTRHRLFREGRLVQTIELRDLVEVGGQWWATNLERSDAEGRVVRRTRLDVEALGADEVGRELAARAGSYEDVLFIPSKRPALAIAKQAVHDGVADLSHHVRLVEHWGASQQWARSMAAWNAAAELMEGRPGSAWIRATLLSRGRKGEELDAALLELAGSLRAAPPDNVVYLAERLKEMAARGLGAIEHFRLHDVLADVFTAEGPDRSWRSKRWRASRATLLAAVDRAGEALQLRAELARDHADDIDVVSGYLRALLGAGRRDQVVEVANEHLEQPDLWLSGELDRLFSLCSDALWQDRKMPDLVALLARWVGSNTHDAAASVRYLSAMIFSGREADADRWMEGVMAEEFAPDDRAQVARLRAAIQLAIGRGWNFRAFEIQEKWQRPLGVLARRLAAAGRRHGALVSVVVGDHRFRRTGAYAQLRKDLVADFLAPGAVEAMDEALVAGYVQQISWSRSRVNTATWRSAVERLRVRWRQATDSWTRYSLASSLLAVLDGRSDKVAAIEHLEEWLGSATTADRPGIAARLFDRLVAQQWSQPTEDRLFSLLPLLLGDGQRDAARRQLAAARVRTLAEKLNAARLKAELGPVAELEKLTRDDRDEAERRALVVVRGALRDSFTAQSGQLGSPWRPWLRIEALGFAARLGEDLAEVEAAAADLLSDVPEDPEDQAWRVLRERASLVMAHAATRRDASAELGDAVLARYMSLREAAEDQLDWTYQIFRLLVALDRSAELEQQLRGWILPDRLVSNWRIALGYLLAERGELAEAATWLEEVARDDELDQGAYAALERWYLVLDDDERRARARLDRLRATPERELIQRVRALRRDQSRSGGSIPAPLSEDDVLVVKALLSKASQPSWYVSDVQRLYAATKDFRVLAGMADGVMGHSRHAVYEFLGSVVRSIDSVHEEATCDAVAARLTELEGTVTTAADRRGLSLLRAMVERRAGQVVDNPGVHFARGVEAMTSAFEGELDRDEVLRYAAFLASLGRMGEPRYGDEQLRQLNALMEREEGGTNRHMHLATHLARTRWSYGDHDRAIDTLDGALRARRAVLGGALPAAANGAVQTLMGWLHHRKSFAAAERFLQQELAEQASVDQRHWYRHQLHNSYTECLRQGGVVSLGRGAALYEALSSRFEQVMWSCAGGQVGMVVNDFCRLHQIAQESAGVSAAGADLARFARDRLPAVLGRMVTGSSDAAVAVARSLKGLGEASAGLELLVSRAEDEPGWHHRVRADIWDEAALEMAQLRAAVSDLGPLGQRLLVLASAELERALRASSSFRQAMFDRRVKYFWADQRDAFAAVAARVLAASKESPYRTLHVADYLWNGLALKDDAIVALLDAEDRGALEESGRYRLVQWLHDRRRFGESLSILRELTTARPDRLNYQVAHITALHETARDEEAARRADATEARFKQQDRWSNSVLASMAYACLRADLFEHSARYYDELIATLSRAGSRRSGLASYYAQAARAYVGLGQTDKAVDRASAAVVAWGENREQRIKAIDSLRGVLASIEDLDAFVADRDAVTVRSGLDSPLLRKLLGLVYMERGDEAAAIAQLRASRELDPLDRETHQALVRAHDRAGDPNGALAALLSSARMSPMDLELYVALGSRYDALGQGARAERAWTTLAEMKPNEADGHRLLAQHREQQEDYVDAIVQWRQVVRARAEEPDGWLSLAQAQVKASRIAKARETLQGILSRTWPERFGEVHARASELLRDL